MGSNLAVGNVGNWIVDAPDSFCENDSESIWNSNIFVTLNELGPIIHIVSSFFRVFCISIVLETSLLLEYISCSTYMDPIWRCQPQNSTLKRRNPGESSWLTYTHRAREFLIPSSYSSTT